MLPKCPSSLPASVESNFSPPPNVDARASRKRKWHPPSGPPSPANPLNGLPTLTKFEGLNQRWKRQNGEDWFVKQRPTSIRKTFSLHYDRPYCEMADPFTNIVMCKMSGSTKVCTRGIVADRPIPGSNVLVTAGAWTSLLCPELAKAAPVTPVKGQVILLRPRTPLFKRLLKRGKTYLIPTASGDVLVGSTSEPEAGFDEQPTLSAREQLVEAACEIVPALRDATFVEQWVGLRPQTDSRSPHVGPVPNVASLFVAAGHFKIGIAMAPVLGNLTRQMLDPTAESST